MDRYIVAYIHPFVLEQEISIYGDNGELWRTFSCTLDQMEQMLYEICESYGVQDVHIKGGQLYAMKFKDDFVANKFGNKNINIIIEG